MDIADIKFDDRGLVPAVAQSERTGEVLMLAYMNEESIEKTLSTGLVYYYSRSREKLWQKGETSGNVQRLRSIRYDCDMDTLLLTVDQTGPACHTGERSCFYRELGLKEGAVQTASSTSPSVLADLFDVIESRREADPDSSYVAKLFKKGRGAILDKVAEESGELIEAVIEGADKKEIVHETADLWFHTLVLMAEAGVDVAELFKELSRRFGTSGLEEKRLREKKG